MVRCLVNLKFCPCLVGFDNILTCTPGGPGGGVIPGDRTFFNPEKYKVLLIYYLSKQIFTNYQIPVDCPV